MDALTKSALALRRAYAMEIARALDSGREPDPFAVQMWRRYVNECAPSIQALHPEAA